MTINWRNTSTLAAVALLVLALAMIAMSQGPPGGRGGFRGGPGRDALGPITRDLNLTEEQKAQIKKIQQSFEAGNKELFEQLRTAHENEPDPLTGNFDEAAVRCAAEARARVDVELAVSRAKMMAQIAAVLTPEQKSQLSARRQEMGHRPPPPDQQP